MLKLAKIDSIQKKVNQYSYASTDPIGKGFSSQVYKGRNEQTGIHICQHRWVSGNKDDRHEDDKRKRAQKPTGQLDLDPEAAEERPEHPIILRGIQHKKQHLHNNLAVLRRRPI